MRFATPIPRHADFEAKMEQAADERRIAGEQEDRIVADAIVLHARSSSGRGEVLYESTHA